MSNLLSDLLNRLRGRGGTEKPFSYYDLLNAFRDSKSCPFCDVELIYNKRYFDALLYESVNDPSLRAELARGMGFCQRHAHFLLSVGDALGVGIIYKDQIELFIKMLENKKFLPLKKLRKELSCIERSCQACKVENEARGRLADTFWHWLEDAEFKAALEGSSGICFEHFRMLVEKGGSEKQIHYLMEILSLKYSALHSELCEFIRKNDYRFAKEGFGKEADSWQRAVKMSVGDEVSFSPSKAR